MAALRALVRRRRAGGERLGAPFDAPSIRTPRLTLRPHRLTDARQWYVIQSDPSVVEYLPWPVRTRAESFEHLAHRTRHTRLSQADDFLALAVELDGRLIGDVSAHLRDVNPARRSAEIGWVFDPAFSGRGYAAEAASALLDQLFDVVGATIVHAVVHPENVRSLALAARLGFEEGGGTERAAARHSSSIVLGVTAAGRVEAERVGARPVEVRAAARPGEFGPLERRAS